MNRASHGSGCAFSSDAAVSRERIDVRRVCGNSGEVADESDQCPRRKRGVRLTAHAHGHGLTSRPWHPAPTVVGPPKPSPTYARSERPGRSLLDHFVRSMLLLFLLLSPAVAEDDPPAAEDRQREQRLGQKLLKKAAKGGDEDVMDRTSRLMGEAAKRLQTDLDPGDDTQAVQRSVLEQLDRAIKQAAAQRRPKQSPSPSSKSDKRRAPPKPSTAEKRRQQGSDSAAADATPSKRTTPDDAKNRDAAGGELHESRRGWGNLPDRERDELIQGFDEESLERYRAWIERYYRALQEVDH